MIRSYERPYDPSTSKVSDQKNFTLDNLGLEVGQYENHSPEQTYSPHEVSVSPIKQERKTGMHMAEKLVENQTGKNAFKFDTITPLKLGEGQDIQINETALGMYRNILCYRFEFYMF